MNKEVEEYESPYCEVCGTCGYIGCCGIRNFIEEHIKGKTNCKNEDLIISELIDICEYESGLQQIIDKAEECIMNFLCSEEYCGLDGIAIAKNYEELLEILRGNSNE